MSGRQSKKIRQLFRKEYRGEAQKVALKNYAKHLVNPKPKWMPAWAWQKLCNLVLKA